jgi:thiamine biosynthesis lipoprotein
MSDTAIYVFSHHAMATIFQARIAGEDRNYAAQAAQVAFDLVDQLESLLSRFRENSEIRRIAELFPGEKMRLSQPVYACLKIAREMETATHRAFCIAPAALQTQHELPRWSLAPDELSIRCEAGKLNFDLGAIGKGYALDCMAEELSDWDCPSCLLIAGGSSVLAGAPPPGGALGWSVGLGEDNSETRCRLSNGSLSGSGVAVKGKHILDPRTGKPAEQRPRAWALASTAAESDALSTAAMVLSEPELAECLAGCKDWLVFLKSSSELRHFGGRELPAFERSPEVS